MDASSAMYVIWVGRITKAVSRGSGGCQRKCGSGGGHKWGGRKLLYAAAGAVVGAAIGAFVCKQWFGGCSGSGNGSGGGRGQWALILVYYFFSMSVVCLPLCSHPLLF